MNRTEAMQLLAYIGIFDNRDVTEAAGHAWAAALSDVPLDEDVRTAVTEFYRTPPKNPGARLWMEPHHVITGRRRIRDARLERFVYEPQSEGEDTATYLANLKVQREAVASGVHVPNARYSLEGGPAPKVAAALAGIVKDVPDDESPKIKAAKEAIQATRKNRLGVMGIECPRCDARIGQPCTIRLSGKRRGKPHPARVEASQAGVGR